MNLSETVEVLAAISELRRRGVPMALATIVGVKGSTYRRPGARFLVPDEGVPVGNLSGGCLEGEVESAARDIMQSGKPRLELYDLTADDEVVWGWGLGCNGTIEVFIESGVRAAQTADALRTAIEEERELAVATVIASDLDDVPEGARLIVEPGGGVRGALGRDDVDGAVIDEARRALAERITETRPVEVAGGTLRVFIESLFPPLRLLVCGAGHDAIPVVRMAAGLGWRVVVADDRAEFLDAERFEGAHAFVKTAPAALGDNAPVDDHTYAVVMSHNYLRDRDYLRALLATGASYIGMLGPHARTERLLGDLATEGVVAAPEDRIRIHGPAGADLGAEGPEQIAVAIVSEILAVSQGRAAGFLRDRSGPIHDRRAAATGQGSGR